MSEITIKDKNFGEERALYGLKKVALVNCTFSGEEDGESALKECGDVAATDCKFELRYPLWHDRSVILENCEMTSDCRAALWYTENITISHTKMYGIKALRECKNAVIQNCDIDSPEFGWSTDGLMLIETTARSEYFAMRASDVTAHGLDFKGKYSFQYIKGGKFKRCKFDTKDAFWHSENVTVEDSVVIGEYLGWYSKNLTFKNCTIIGTQPLCYCKNLKLIDCVMQKTDLCFEKSEVRATLRSSVDSIKNPYKGVIVVPSVGEIIRDDTKSKAKIMITPSLEKNHAA